MQVEGGALLTMDDSRMSVFAGTTPFGEDSRMSVGAPLLPDELVEWRGGGNSLSSASLGELIPCSRDASRDISRLVAGSRGPFLSGGDSRSGPPPTALAGESTVEHLHSGNSRGVFGPEVDQARDERSGAVQAQWMQPEFSSSSSTDGGASAGASREGTLIGPALPVPPTAKGAPKTKAGGSSGKGGKERSKNSKSASTDGEGEGEKMSGMWTGEENRIFFDALSTHGRSFPKIHNQLQSTKSKEQVRCYYYRVIKKINQVGIVRACSLCCRLLPLLQARSLEPPSPFVVSRS